jgi:hypothetical protein
MHALADLRLSRIAVLTLTWALVIVAVPRLVVGGFYLHHWWQQRAGPPADDATFFAIFRWTSWWVPLTIIAAPPLLLFTARAGARQALASTLPNEDVE